MAAPSDEATSWLESAEAELVRTAREGDTAAFGDLVVLHQRRATKLAWRLLRDPDEADAAVQDAFLKAWGSLRDFRGECPFGAWLSRIVVNLCRDRLKKKNLVISESRLVDAGNGDDGPADVLGQFADEAPNPERQALGREIARRIAGEMAQLPEMQREVFALRYYEDMNLSDIAAVFRIDVGTVKTHLFRATHKVRRALEVIYGQHLPF